MGCNASTCPHPTGPIILRALGVGGIIAVVVVVLGVLLAIVIWGRGGRPGGWGGGSRMGGLVPMAMLAGRSDYGWVPGALLWIGVLAAAVAIVVGLAKLVDYVRWRLASAPESSGTRPTQERGSST